MATPNRYSGRVSPDGSAAHEAIAATMRRTQAASSALVCSEPIAGMSQRLDRRRRPELSAKPADADVDDVRARAEVIAPDGGEEPFTAQDLARVQCEVVQQPELPVGDVGLGFADPCGLRSGTCAVRGDAFGGKPVGNEFAYPRFVLDDQNPHV